MRHGKACVYGLIRFCLFSVLAMDAVLQPNRPPTSRCNQYFLGFPLHSSLQRYASGVRLAGNRHMHTYRLKLAVLTFIHMHTHTKYIHTQSARAVPPKSLILVNVCFTMSMFDIYISRCNHLLSIQSPAGTVLSFQPAPLIRGWPCLSYCFQQPASRLKVSSPASSLRTTNQLCLE